MATLDLDNITISYGKDAPTVPLVNEKVVAEEWLALIGPNGAGKSTLLKAIAGLVPFSGEIRVGGVKLQGLSNRRRAALVAYVAQNPVLPHDMSVYDYVLLGRSPYIGYFSAPGRADFDVVDDIVERMQLEAFQPRMLGELSGGERQRVVIARALAQQAPVLLLDEPTSALDIGHQQQAFELVDQIRREHGLTVISAMHDLTLAGLYADRLTLLHEGVVVANGTAVDVLSADNLTEFYGVNASVQLESDGTVVVIPRRSSTAFPNT